MTSTFVGEVIMNRVVGSELSEQTRSTIGLDPFLYVLRNKMPPSSEQAVRLLNRVYNLACDMPETLFRAAFFEQLRELLGDGYEFVQLPSTKTESCPFSVANS